MLVYGDHAERAESKSRLLALQTRMERGPWDHDQLTRLFVDLAGITQGVADADFTVAGHDRHRPAETRLLEQLTVIAAALLRSFEEGCKGTAALPPLELPDDLPGEIEIKLPEGYAFYALRPEAYALAARQLRLSGPPQVIGLRSIGSGLACMAAAALGAVPPVTLRPIGDPFDRRPRLAPELAATLLEGEAHYVIVDEGPGLSGSSLGGVADWLEDHGVAAERIAFLPGHDKPLGSQAAERHRARWAAAQKPVVALDRPTPAQIEPLIGPLTQPLQDTSGGEWRAMVEPARSKWPAIDPTWERRKFLARTESGCWLVKWAGLGSIGERKLLLARQLRPWAAEVEHLTGGWLLSRWEDAAPARPSVAELVDYLRLRASLPAPQPGASLETLLTMIRRNLPSHADWSPDLGDLHPRPVCTDNRMAPYEWLRRPDGHLLKADALDHHQSHDLIGCQDIGWDVAGAIVELDLASSDTEQLRAQLSVDRALLDFLLVAYHAFRIGSHRMSAASLAHWPEEQARHFRAVEQLEARLAAVDPVKHASHVH